MNDKIDLGHVSRSDIVIIIKALRYCSLNKANISTETLGNIHDETFDSLADIFEDCLKHNITISESYSLQI